MNAVPQHPYAPRLSFDGGHLDCGNGLLLLIRQHIDRLEPGELLEILSAEPSVCEDLPAWSRLTGNELVSVLPLPDRTSFLVSRGACAAANQRGQSRSTRSGDVGIRDSKKPESAADGHGHENGHRHGHRLTMPVTLRVQPVFIPDTHPAPATVPAIPPLSVMGIGSWPRPPWLMRLLHEHLDQRLSAAEFHAAADDAVRLAIAAQQRAGVDVLTDGEQRRDDYAGFVGGLLDNCQLIPIIDLLPYVDHPDDFAAQLKSLDVPADRIRHPAVYGPLSRVRPFAVHEFQFVRSLTPQAVKVSLPGPYLLSRMMWMECISDRAYATRADLAVDIVRVLREELHALLAEGVALVQLDEPVLTEVVYGRVAAGNRSFMCGALGNRGTTDAELDFAAHLITEVTRGLPGERLALHVCRGNWTANETAALAGDYRPLLPLLSTIPVGTLFLELCTSRAGEIDVLRQLPEDRRIGVGVVNQKTPHAESIEEIVDRAERAIRLFGAQRVLLNPDCGFATFADNPVTTAELAERRLQRLCAAADRLRRVHRVG